MFLHGFYRISHLTPSIGLAVYKDISGNFFRQIVKPDHRIAGFTPADYDLESSRFISNETDSDNFCFKADDFAVYCLILGDENVQIGNFDNISKFIKILFDDKSSIDSRPFLKLELASFINDEEEEIKAAAECDAALKKFGGSLRARWLDSIRNETFSGYLTSNDNHLDANDIETININMTLSGSIQTLVSMTRYSKNVLNVNRSVEIRSIISEKISSPKFVFDAEWFYDFSKRYVKFILEAGDQVIALEYFNEANARMLVPREENSRVQLAASTVYPSILRKNLNGYVKFKSIMGSFLSTPGRRRTLVIFSEFCKRHPGFLDYYFSNPITRYYNDLYHRTLLSHTALESKKERILNSDFYKETPN